MIFPGIKGQRRATTALSGFLSTERIPSAILFVGPAGTGKTMLAREFAKALLCGNRKTPADAACGSCSDCLSIERRNHPDVACVNASYQAQLEEEAPEKQRTLHVATIRHARRDMEMQSLMGGWKVAIIEEAHTLEIEAANALLKILEEPNARSIWILTTSQKERLPRTIPSRCFTVPFSPLPPQVVRDILLGQGVPAQRAAELAEFCEGSASRALELAEGEFPQSLLAGPMAPFEAAEALPRELYLARTHTEQALFALAQSLRLRHLQGRIAFSGVEGPLREILRLRQALRSNADPRTVLILACLESEAALAT